MPDEFEITSEPPTRLRDLSIDQLRALYVEVIDRKTQDGRYQVLKLH